MALSHAVLYSQFAISITIIRVANSVYSDDFDGRTSAIYERRSASRGLLVTIKRTRLFGQ